MKKIMSLLFTFILLISILPSAFAQNTEVTRSSTTDSETLTTNSPTTDSEIQTSSTTDSEIPISNSKCDFNIKLGDSFALISQSNSVTNTIVYEKIDPLNREIIFRDSIDDKIEVTYELKTTCADSIGQGYLIIGRTRFKFVVGAEPFNIAIVENKVAQNLNLQIINQEDNNNKKIKTQEIVSYKRYLNEEKIKIANENFMIARKKFVTSNSKYNDLKKKFAEIIAEIKKVCENYPDSEKCVEMNSKSFEIGRDLLLKGTESAIEHLKQIIAKIEASEDVSSEDAKMRLNELNTYITSLVSLYEMVENAQTKEELKEAAIKLETLWALIKFDSKVQTLKLMNDKLEGIYNRAKSVENKLKCSLTPVSDEKEKEILINLEKYNDLLESAKEKHEKGILLLNSALRDKNFEQIEESKNLMLESYNIIKKSQGLIISIFNEIKNAGGELNACNA